MSVPIPILILVFTAVGFGVFVLAPLLLEFGMTQGLKEKQSADEANKLDPIYRFMAPEKVLQLSWTMAMLGGGILAAALVASGVYHPLIVLPLTVGAGFALFPLPKLWLKQRVKSRKRQFESRVLDLTVNLASCLRAGGGLPQALEMVMHDMSGPMGEELGILLYEYRIFNVPLPDAFDRMCKRMPCEDISLLTTALRVTLQTGGSLADVLDKITGTIRARTDFQQKLSTMTAQGRFEAIAIASMPLVAFGILYMIDPELMKPLVTTTIGWAALGGILILEVVGFVTINKIVTVEC